jgi:dolichol kinase
MDREILRQLIHASGIFILILGIFLKPEILILLCVMMVIFVEMLFVLDKTHHIPFFRKYYLFVKELMMKKDFCTFSLE